MEGALELEDDVFFKDLSKQISLLIMDDDDEDSLPHSPSVNLQALSRAIHHPSTQASFFSYDHQQIGKRERKGTGVFIPRSTSNSRRKNMYQARFMPSGNKFQSNSRGLAHSSNPSHDQYSSDFRRF